jgi:hypothetical protein
VSSGGRIGFLAALAAGAVAVSAVVLVAFDWRGTSTPPAQPRTAPAVTIFPSPPPGAVVFAREAGPNVLALGVVPHRGAIGLQASVLDGDARGVSGLRIVFSVRGVDHPGNPCGHGCYRTTVALSAPPNAVSVALFTRSRSTRWRVPLPAAWPPPDGAAIIARAGRVWRSLRSVAYVEHLASDATTRQTSDWRVAAPNRVAYSIRGSGGGIVIGTRRWDRSTSAGRWLASQQSAVLTQPVPFWVGVSDAHVLRSDGSAWIVSFFDPRTPGWFEATVDKQTGHTLELRMFAAAHFMHDVYGSFDQAPPIVPPR